MSHQLLDALKNGIVDAQMALDLQNGIPRPGAHILRKIQRKKYSPEEWTQLILDSVQQPHLPHVHEELARLVEEYYRLQILLKRCTLEDYQLAHQCFKSPFAFRKFTSSLAPSTKQSVEQHAQHYEWKSDHGDVLCPNDFPALPSKKTKSKHPNHQPTGNTSTQWNVVVKTKKKKKKK